MKRQKSYNYRLNTNLVESYKRELFSNLMEEPIPFEGEQPDDTPPMIPETEAERAAREAAQAERIRKQTERIRTSDQRYRNPNLYLPPNGFVLSNPPTVPPSGYTPMGPTHPGQGYLWTLNPQGIYVRSNTPVWLPQGNPGYVPFSQRENLTPNMFPGTGPIVIYEGNGTLYYYQDGVFYYINGDGHLITFPAGVRPDGIIPNIPGQPGGTPGFPMPNTIRNPYLDPSMLQRLILWIRQWVLRQNITPALLPHKPMNVPGAPSFQDNTPEDIAPGGPRRSRRFSNPLVQNGNPYNPYNPNYYTM